MTEYPPIGDLVPHEPPILALEALTEWEPGKATCAVQVREGAAFVENHQLTTLMSIEYLGQAVAACLGYEAYQGGEGVRVGMIIGCRKLELRREFFRVGEKLDVQVHKVRGDETLSRFSGSVRAGEEVVAEAELTLFHAEKPPE